MDRLVMLSFDWNQMDRLVMLSFDWNQMDRLVMLNFDWNQMDRLVMLSFDWNQMDRLVMLSFDCCHRFILFILCCCQMDRINKAREDGWKHLIKSGDEKDEVNFKFDGFISFCFLQHYGEERGS